jgi:6-phosphogluconolactonase
MANPAGITLTRRGMLGAAAAFTLAPIPSRADSARLLFAGTYGDGKDDGLVPLIFHPDDGTLIAGAPQTQIRNASFGAYHRRFALQYLVDEAKGRFAVWRASARGWTRLAERPSLGDGPCFVSLDAAENCLAIANYNSGNVVLYRLDPASGLPVEPPQVLQDAGRGPNAARQEGPHAHCARFSPDQRFLYSTDLGTDEILASPYDAVRVKLGARFTAYQAPSGSGPRHLVFHPGLPFAYLASELGNTLTVLKRLVDGRLERMQTLSTLPENFTAHSQVAHIAMNTAGTRLYVSNRGHNSIAVFALGRAGQALLKQIVPSGGDWPRFFLLLEDCGWMLVANQNSGTIVPLCLARDGSLAPGGKALAIPQAVYIGRANE